MLAMEFVNTKNSKTPNPEACSKVMEKALSKGLMLLKAGLYNNCIRLHPPLTMKKEFLHKGINILSKTLKETIH